jgi:hypothetical protein
MTAPGAVKEPPAPAYLAALNQAQREAVDSSRHRAKCMSVTTAIDT